ncbi:hypothetical protein [Bradyrhizobium cenepequi]
MKLARSALPLLAALLASPAVAQTYTPRPVLAPNPFSPGSAVYSWHYICPTNNPDGTCRFSILAASYAGNNVADVQAVLAYQTVGLQQIPFYYFRITFMGNRKPDLLMIQANAAVSFAAHGMAQDTDTGPIAS